MSAALPRSSKCSSTFTWDDGSNFSGYLLLGLVPPTGRTFANLDSQFVSVQVPPFVRLKVIDGTPDQLIGVIYNADLNPPGFEYVGWLEDEQKTLVAGPSSQFTVTSTTFTVSPGTPASPTVGDTPSTPNWDATDLP